MALINWTPALSVNITEIDNQHKKLIGMLNDLHDAMKTGKGKETVGKVLNDLASYTVSHFSYEEQLFKKHSYPDMLKHKSEHDKLTSQVMELKGRHSEGSLAITMDVMNFLKDWLNKHILESDKKYVPFFNGLGIK